METYWESISNKRKLQQLLFRWMTNNSHVQSQEITFVLNGMAQELQIILCQSVQNGEVETLPELDNNIEEADVRLIPYALHAVLAGTERIVILSSDTDILVTALYFWNLLNSLGLRQFWMRARVGDSTRYIPLHSFDNFPNKWSIKTSALLLLLLLLLLGIIIVIIIIID